MYVLDAASDATPATAIATTYVRAVATSALHMLMATPPPMAPGLLLL